MSRNGDVRRNSVSVMLSDRELAAIDEYCDMFKRKSRSEVIREGAVRFVRKRIIDRQTSLFHVPCASAVEEPQADYAQAPRRGEWRDETPSLFETVFPNTQADEGTD